MPLLSLVDFLFFEMERRIANCSGITGARCGKSARGGLYRFSAANRRPLLDVLRLVAVLFFTRDPKQALGGDVACRACPMCLVANRPNSWREYFSTCSIFVISAVASVWTIFEQKFHAGAIGAEWAQSWPERLIIAGRAIWFYLAKLVWPDSADVYLSPVGY